MHGRSSRPPRGNAPGPALSRDSTLHYRIWCARAFATIASAYVVRLAKSDSRSSSVHVIAVAETPAATPQGGEGRCDQCGVSKPLPASFSEGWHLCARRCHCRLEGFRCLDCEPEASCGLSLK